MTQLLQSVEVQTTRFDPIEAELTVTAVLPEVADDAELRGRLMGPRCVDRETVEVAYPLKPLPPEGDLLRARVIIPEASPWSPKTPFRYEGPVELWRGEQKVEEAWLAHGLRHLVLRRKGFFLNGEALPLRGVQRGRCDEADARELHASGCNLLVTRVTESTSTESLSELATIAEKFGLLVLGQFEGADEPAFWTAEAALLRRVACLGWLMPQSLLTSPQVWHQAMALLHGHRREIFVGLQVQEPPLPVLPGHISFLAGDEEILEGLGEVSLPRLFVLRRGQAEPEDRVGPNTVLLGCVHR